MEVPRNTTFHRRHTMDYTKTLRQLNEKAARQKEALEATQQHITAIEQLQINQDKPKAGAK